MNNYSNTVFEACQRINELINGNHETEARDQMIRLLANMKEQGVEYTPVVNHLIRELGLYPYIHMDSALWQDQIVHEAFKVDLGNNESKTLHSSQSHLLKKLLNGENFAVSAPTSYGKSFIIDAYIAIKKPRMVVIIVPTIALTDETRRRLYGKFSSEYNIVTTPEVELGDKNIFIFPQERVFGYLDKINDIDILIIDEFYKAEASSDERSSILIKAILMLREKAKQRYFLAPNISSLEDNPFTKGMEFIRVDFKTVVTSFFECFKDLKDKEKEEKENIKKGILLNIVSHSKTKSLIYAGSYSQINNVVNFLCNNLTDVDSEILNDFSEWLAINYGKDYSLVQAVKKGTGVHNGRLHRSLSQIQVRLFEKARGLNNLVSTSSIIEGVNTSAENVILWSNKNGNNFLSCFDYNNIVGRSGRMFKYFVGKVYALETPPQREAKDLKLDFPDDVLVSLDSDRYKGPLTREQIIKIIAFSEEVDIKIGKGTYNKLINDPTLVAYTGFQIRDISAKLLDNEKSFITLPFLLSNNLKEWNNPLRECFFNLKHMNLKHYQFVRFVKIISQNWSKSIPELMIMFKEKNVPVDVDSFFEYERLVSFDLVSLLGKVNTIMKYLRPKPVDISSFIFRASHAFLPKLVYELEEYGLPRMMSRKIQNSGLINLEDDNKTMNEVIIEFVKIGTNQLSSLLDLSNFEDYILRFFYKGILRADIAEKIGEGVYDD